MSRRGGTRVEEYEEREYYAQDPPPQRERAPPVRGRDLEELYMRRPDDRDRQPAFLREDYARVEEQPLVLRERKVETFTRPVQRRSPPRERSPSIERERVRTRVVERERERSPSPQPVMERTRTRVVERERQRSPSPPPVVERTRTRVVERERERDRSPESDRLRMRLVERERDRDISPARSEIRTRLVERERERERPRSPSIERERIRTTTRTVERERDRSPSPVQERERIRTRVVERERERRRSPSSSSGSSAGVSLEPPIIRAPPIHQEIITHHRHIDHGYDYAPAPTPPLPVSRRPAETRETEIDIYTGRGETEIDIHKTKGRGGREREDEFRTPRNFVDDDVLYERDQERERLRVRTSQPRPRSVSARRDHDAIAPYEAEAEYYGRKVDERAYIGEAYNGATKDWAIVDVPPGTERVKMDGVGGASEEITWQRYNGVRRSKFLPERDSQASYDREYEREEVSDRRVGRPLPPPRNKYGDMWTEITKDLVVREAIEEIGYDYEETEFFYYVIQYLRYEDVEELVHLSEHIKKERKNRIREMALERERLKERNILAIEAPPKERKREFDDERIIEREIIYEPSRRPRGYLR